MQIKKRSFPMYVFLNCLTLGIYGLIVSTQINKEINALCKGDNEQPRFTYMAAVLFRGIAPVLGLIVGLIVGLAPTSYGIVQVINNINQVFTDAAGSSSFVPSLITTLGKINGEFALSLGTLVWDITLSAGAAKAIAVFCSMLSFEVLFTAVGSLISGIYLNYWWYKQANRLKLNAGRYGLVVKESGTDNFMFRTVMEILFIPISIILIVLSFAIPAFIVWLITLADSAGATVFAVVLLWIFANLMMFFGMELTTGANFGMFFMFKNLSRFADVYRNGAKSFDPMAYEYYPSVSNKYPNFVPSMISGNEMIETPAVEPPTGPLATKGTLIGMNGSCAGYEFDLTSGEEIIIGKDAKVSMVVIDPAYKEISRKHVSVCYDIVRDQYCVVDYSSNGTWANGKKLPLGQEVYLSHGTELKLANDKNTFRLG